MWASCTGGLESLFLVERRHYHGKECCDVYYATRRISSYVSFGQRHCRLRTIVTFQEHTAAVKVGPTKLHAVGQNTRSRCQAAERRGALSGHVRDVGGACGCDGVLFRFCVLYGRKRQSHPAILLVKIENVRICLDAQTAF